jgi:acetyl esterase/lipase
LVCVFAADQAALVDAIRAGASDGLGVVLDPGLGDAATAARRVVDDLDCPIVWLDLDEAERPRPGYLDDLSMVAIRGRGVFGYRWAIQWLMQRVEYPFTVIPYGDERDQVGDLRLPGIDGDGPFPVAVFLHGGFWRERWERDTIEPLAIDLARRGFATWNLEYRRVGPYGGGWPNTCQDVADGIDKLAELAREYPLDLERVILVGHSAGGHLALWAVKRLGVSGAAHVDPVLVVSLAGVADLEEGARRGLGDTGNGTEDLMGGPPEQRAEAYAAASPIRALPLGVPQLVVQGRLDNIPDLVDMSRLYAAAASAAGDQVEFVELDDADHFHLIVPTSHAWPPVLERIQRAASR